MRVRRMHRGLLAVPTAAVMVIAAGAAPVAATGVGAGVAQVTITFNPQFPLQNPPAQCFVTQFTASGGTQTLGLAASTGGPLLNGTTEYVGPATITGSGGNNCAGPGFEDGGINLTITGNSNIAGSVLCNLSGSYLRVAVQIHVQMFGFCTLNGVSLPGINFVVEGDLVPIQGPVQVGGPPTNPTISITPTYAAEFIGAYVFEQ
jgi:hypothetical protein